MKRDMDLIREMLLAVEAYPSGFAPDIKIDGYTDEQIGYHATLLGEAGLVNVIDFTSFADSSPNAKITSLTWSGYEFLESSRDQHIWEQAKTALGKFGGASFQIWMMVLTEYIKQQLFNQQG